MTKNVRRDLGDLAASLNVLATKMRPVIGSTDGVNVDLDTMVPLANHHVLKDSMEINAYRNVIAKTHWIAIM